MEQKRAVLPLQKIEPVMKTEAMDSVLPLIELSSSDSESNDSSASFMSGESISRENSRFSSEEGTRSSKKRKLDIVLPAGFLDPLPPDDLLPLPLSTPAAPITSTVNGVTSGCKQFWKAGDYEVGVDNSMSITETVRGMDHVRVHPKFLHSNATSHKWALGAFAELLDNSLDETCNGATYSSIDMIESKKVGGRMLLIEDNGGGMDPDKMRHCMSLGYSVKSKSANTIGQYGNGFKTSTMRLGADVIVFSRCRQSSKRRATQTIGLLSYTFLRKTCKEDIVVPMLDYEIVGNELTPIIRSSAAVWKNNMETILQWSPYSSEEELLQQASVIKDHGTRIMIYNLWEDDEGKLELDFDSDLHDIQIRGVNRDEKNIQMAKQFPNSKHFLTYKHSLRNYVSILYLRIPPGFRIMLRGKDVEHHNIVNDMMMSQEISYRPQAGHEGATKESNMVAVVRIGFVKDAKFHIDVQGFNVYHKNRLIKPFWRIWNAAGSDGRGVIGVLEANFVEPAHDKQGFERTTVLSRLESRLQQMQKSYWATNCHKIGYAPRGNKKEKDLSGKVTEKTSSQSTSTHNKASDQDHRSSTTRNIDGTNYSAGKRTINREPSSTEKEDEDDDDGIFSTQTPGPVNRKYRTINSLGVEASCQQSPEISDSEKHHSLRSTTSTTQKSNLRQGSDTNNITLGNIRKLEEEKLELNERLKKEEMVVEKLKSDLEFEKARSKSLQKKLEELEMRCENMNKEQESLIDIFSEERGRRDAEEDTLRKKLADASNSIQELLDKVKFLEKMKPPKRER